MRRRGGFTLLEVVVAVGILALIGTLTFGSIASALDARDILEKDDEVNQAARIAMDRIRRDLSLAYLTPNTQAVNTYRTVFVAKDEDPDAMWFTSLSHQRLYRDAREGDQTELTYWLEDDPNVRGAYVLLHREAPRIDHEPDKDGVIYPLAYGVKSFDLRFLDKDTQEWVEEWDTTGADNSNELPRAVQVTLVLLAPAPEDEDEMAERTFATTVVLQFASPLPRNALDGGGSDE